MALNTEEQEKIIDMYNSGMKIQDIADDLHHARATIRSVLRGAGILLEGSWTPADRKWVNDNLVELRKQFKRKEEKPGKYRVVHPGEKGIRTMYRPDGRF